MDAPPNGSSRLSAYHRLLFVFLGVAGFFEGYDTFSFSQVLPKLRVEMGLSIGEVGLLNGFINIGWIIAFLLVRAADRWGRRPVLTITILGYTLCTLLTAASPGVLTFAVAQLCARVFLGAEWAVATVYAAEEFPAARRGTVIGALQGLNALGAVVVAGVAPMLFKLPLGWRSVYLVGAVPLLLLAIARRSLRETRRFTEQVALRGTTQRAFTAILQGPYRKRVLLLALLWTFTYINTNIAVTFWKDHALVDLKISDSEAGINIAIAAVGAMPLAFAAGPLIDRAGRRVGAFIIYGMTIAGCIGAYALETRALIIVSLIFGIAGVTAVGIVLSAYTSELFPTDLRSDAFGWSNHLLGRTALVAAPPLVGYAADQVGYTLAVSATTVFPAMALVLILLLLPETTGQELEATSAT